MSNFPHIHPSYSKQLPLWTKWRDASAGEEAVKARGEEYLPRLFMQSADEYKQYLRGATYYNATGKTVDALSSAHFRREPALSLGKLEPLKERACHNQTLTELAEHAAQELWTVGRCGLLSEFNKSSNPQIYLYAAESIVNWRMVEDVLVFVILCETYETPSKDSAYVFETKKQYRVLELVTAQQGDAPDPETDRIVYRQRVLRLVKGTDEKEEWREIPELTEIPRQAGDEPLSFIPFTFLNYESEGAAVGGSPIADLASLNLKHYVGSADAENILHLACSPFLEVVGLPETERPRKFPVNSATVLYLDPMPGAGARWVVCSSDGVKPRQEDLRAKEDQMARMGGSFLRAQKREAETAESMRLQQSGESSVLTKITGSLAKGFTQAVRFLGRWMGYEEAPLSVTPSNEYFESKIEQWEATLLIQLYQASLLNKEQLYEGLQGGGILKKEWLQALLKASNDGLKKETDNSTGRSTGEPLQATQPNGMGA
jgi:hypothetical protein